MEPSPLGASISSPVKLREWYLTTTSQLLADGEKRALLPFEVPSVASVQEKLGGGGGEEDESQPGEKQKRLPRELASKELGP